MEEIYGIHSFNTNITLFTEKRQKEKHLFNFEYGVFFQQINFGLRFT